MDVLVAFTDAVVVDAFDSVVFDADMKVGLVALPVVAVVASVLPSVVGAAGVVFVDSSLAARKTTVSISLRPSRGIRAATVISPGTRRIISASKGKNRILSRYEGQSRRNCHSIGLAMGNEDLGVCIVPIPVRALCRHASLKLDISSSSSSHVKVEQKTPVVEYQEYTKAQMPNLEKK